MYIYIYIYIYSSQRLVHESKSDFAKAIREQLDRIEAASSSSSKVQIAPDTPQSSSKIGVLEHDQMSIASSNIDAFQEESYIPGSFKNPFLWKIDIFPLDWFWNDSICSRQISL